MKSIVGTGYLFMCTSTSIMSIDPLSCVDDSLLNDHKDIMRTKRSVQNRGMQIKP